MSAEELFCERCGSRLSPTAIFCGSCGAPTGRGARPPAPPPVASGPPPGYVPPPPSVAAPSGPPPGPPPAWAGGTGYAAPGQSYGPPPGPPPGPGPAPASAPPAAAPPIPPGAAGQQSPSIASQLPSLARLAAQADHVAIIGGVLVAVAMVVLIASSSGFLSFWWLFTPILLAAGPIVVGFLRRNDQVGTQFAMATYLSFGALAATTYWTDFFQGITGGGLFSAFGLAVLIGGIGAIIVLVAGVALLRTNSVR